MFDNKNRHYGGPPFREKRYAHLDSALNARQQREMSPRGRGDSINSRYSSDPVQVLQDNGKNYCQRHLYFLHILLLRICNKTYITIFRMLFDDPNQHQMFGHCKHSRKLLKVPIAAQIC